MKKIKMYHIVMAIIIVPVIAFISFKASMHVSASDYVGAYQCNVCNKTFVSWSDYCDECGAKHSDEDLIQQKPYCSECGRRTTMFSETYCRKCGGILLNKEKVPISGIESRYVKWCIKHI